MTDTAETGHPTATTTPGFFAALGATLLWSVGNVAIAGSPINGLALAFHRLWIAAIIFTAVLYATGGRLTAASFRHGWKGAVFFTADIATFYLAVKYTTLADATTISALQPALILFIAGSMFGERVRPRHIVCTVIAIVGVLAVVRGSSTSGDVTAFGEVMAVLALFAWVGYFVYSKQARQHLGTVEYLTVIMIVGVPLMLPLSLLTGQLTDQGWLSLSDYGWVFLVIALPGTGHLLINWAHNHTTITLTSLLTLLMPAISTACAAVFLDQEVTALTVIGISVVLVSLAFVIAGDARAAAIEAESAEDGPPI